MNCEHYTTDCKVIGAIGSHCLLLCNQTQTISSLPPSYETTTGTPTSTRVTTTEPTTVYSTTGSPRTKAPVRQYTPSPSPHLRGYTPIPDSSYTGTTSESTTTTTTSPSTSMYPGPKYIYIQTNLTSSVSRPISAPAPVYQNIPDVTGLWVYIGVLTVAVVVLLFRQTRPSADVQKRRSIIPAPPAPSVPQPLPKVPRNSWAKSEHDALMHMERQIPKEHRRSMNSLRKQIESKARPPPASTARMQISELSQPGGLDKLKAIRNQRTTGVKKLRHQMGKLRAIRSINKSDTEDK